MSAFHCVLLLVATTPPRILIYLLLCVECHQLATLFLCNIMLVIVCLLWCSGHVFFFLLLFFNVWALSEPSSGVVTAS